MFLLVSHPLYPTCHPCNKLLPRNRVCTGFATGEGAFVAAKKTLTSEIGWGRDRRVSICQDGDDKYRRSGFPACSIDGGNGNTNERGSNSKRKQVYVMSGISSCCGTWQNNGDDRAKAAMTATSSVALVVRGRKHGGR